MIAVGGLDYAAVAGLSAVCEAPIKELGNVAVGYSDILIEAAVLNRAGILGVSGDEGLEAVLGLIAAEP